MVNKDYYEIVTKVCFYNITTQKHKNRIVLPEKVRR